MKKIFGLLLALCVPFFCHAAGYQNTEQQRTLLIIKPEAVADNHIGQIVARFEVAGLQVVGAKMVRLSQEKAGQFYSALKDRSFYPELKDYMSSGPIFVAVLQGIDAIAKSRDIIGATDPHKAKAGTVRADFGKDVQRNAVHGSDSAESAKKEIPFFFSPSEIFSLRSASV
jgi:nucleoside-diphosphate kinase